MPYLAVLVVAAALALPAVARADGAVVVREFTGAKKKAVRDRVLRVLRDAGRQVVDGRPGARPPKSATVIDGNVVMKKSGWALELKVRHGTDDKDPKKVTFRAPWFPTLLKKLDENAADDLAPALDEAAPTAEVNAAKGAEPAAEPAKEEPAAEPAKEEPADEDEPRTSSKDEPSAPAKGRRKRPVPLEIQAGAGVFSRALEYHQDVNRNLHPYHLDLGPTLFVRGGWYPGAHFTHRLAADFGVIGDYERSVGVSSAPEAGRSFGTGMQQYSVGARFRLHLGKHELGFSGSYGRHSFEVQGDRDPNAVAANGAAVQRDFVPDVSYEFVRPALDARIAIGIVHVFAGVGYRFVASTGDVGNDPWFPRARVGAADGVVGVGVEVFRDVFVTAGFDARYYALDMRARVSDLSNNRDIAGGAVDRYLAGRLSLQWRLPGQGSDPPPLNVAKAPARAGHE